MKTSLQNVLQIFLKPSAMMSAVFMMFIAIVGIQTPTHVLAQVPAQVPAFTISSEVPEFGAVQDGPLNIILRERRLTLQTYDELPQRGRIVIRRTAPTTATVGVQFGVVYTVNNRPLPDITTATTTLPSIFSMQNIPRGVTTSSIPINSLQGDLQPLLFLNGFFVGRINTTEAALNQIVFSPQVTEATILFTARWSDQSFPRNPALQGQRIALVRLLNPEGYTIPSGFNAQARITLDDPVNVPPVVQNSLCRQFQPILVSNVQTFFSSVEPGFYDDNYDSLSYTVVSSNEVLMRSRGVLNGVAAFEVLPPSSILWQSSTSPTVSITARDLRGGSTTQTCTVIGVTSNVQATPSPISLSAVPNPADSQARLTYTLQEPSAVQIELYSALGERLFSLDEGMKPRGEHVTTLDLGRLSSGVYPVRVRAGRDVQSVMMRVVR